MTSEAKSLGIYIHVPFCMRKCPYCDFYSCENSLHKRDAYVQAVCRNISFYGNGKAVDTIYFGGGTPSLLSPEHIEDILHTTEKAFNLREPEITMEVNPATVTEESLKEYRCAGVNRISIGIQDLHDDALKTLGRLHTAQQAEDTVYAAKHAGFDNISCDLMIGTMGQTSDRLSETMEKLTSLPITHISAYLLKIEDGTPYAKKNMKSLVPDEDESADLYLQMVSYLEEKGFSQYEVSNFAHKSFESRHNCRYWKCQPYLGIGPAAHSCMDTRFYVPPDLDLFIRDEHQTVISEDEHPYTIDERIMLGLRLSEGIPKEWLDEYQLKTIQKFIKAGLMKKSDNTIAFTPQGYLVSNAILAEILCGTA
ncbi:MAG: radical SAM family heme chaperone HemW [Ruminococcus sp.]|nr:radical SAM family heme chaperone HemW [Ruminococcus sp.]